MKVYMEHDGNGPGNGRAFDCVDTLTVELSTGARIDLRELLELRPGMVEVILTRGETDSRATMGLATIPRSSNALHLCPVPLGGPKR